MSFTVGPIKAMGGGGAILFVVALFPLLFLVGAIGVVVGIALLVLYGLVLFLLSAWDYKKIESSDKPQIRNEGWTAALFSSIVMIFLPAILGVSSAGPEGVFILAVMLYFFIPVVFVAGFVGDEKELLAFDKHSKNFDLSDSLLPYFLYTNNKFRTVSSNAIEERPKYYLFNKFLIFYFLSICTFNIFALLYSFIRITYIGLGLRENPQFEANPT